MKNIFYKNQKSPLLPKEGLGVVLYICLLLTGLGCKKHVDPCANLKPFKADFDIKEHVYDTSFVTDTTLVENFVIFEAKEKYDTYQ